MIEYLDPVTGAFVEALLKSIANKTVELGVNGISVLLGKALKEGDRTQAEKIIKEQAIEKPVAQFVGQVLSEAYIVPVASKDSVTVEDVLQLFQNVISVGIGISSKLGADIYLPGSFLGKKTVSLFSTRENEKGEIDFNIDDRTLKLESSSTSGLAILPQDNPVGFCDMYTGALRTKREGTTKYLPISSNIYLTGGQIGSQKTTRCNNLSRTAGWWCYIDGQVL